MDNLFEWQTDKFIGGNGVITGANEAQEWMLKWWWSHYSKSNTLPVTFFDFGMSKSACLWCKKRGQVISAKLPDAFFEKKNEGQEAIKKLWHKIHRDVTWETRQAWFYKPFALLKTPYEQTIWIDLDCEVKKDISSLLSYGHEGDGFGIALDHAEGSEKNHRLGLLLKEETAYQAGVLVFKRKSPVIETWAKTCYIWDIPMIGDQDILCHVLHTHPFKFSVFPRIYNWLNIEPDQSDVVIYHHSGVKGKQTIIKEAYV